MVDEVGRTVDRGAGRAISVMTLKEDDGAGVSVVNVNNGVAVRGRDGLGLEEGEHGRLEETCAADYA